MTATVATLIRVFLYAGMELPDCGNSLTPAEVRDVYSASYPELTSAEVSGPDMKGDKLVWTFRRTVGTKGASAFDSPPRFCLRVRNDGYSYVEPLPSGRPTTWKDRLASALHALGMKIDALLFRTDLNAPGRRAH